jgi:MATE family multidrug resistance protein
MTFNIATLAFMPIWGFGMAASILVGQHLGENRDDLAARATYTTLWFSYTYIAVISLFYYFTPELFLDPFLRNKNAPPGELDALRALGAELLRIVAIYNLMDATFMVFVSAVKGAGDTRFVMTASLVMSLVLAGFSYLTIEVWRLSLIACWWAVTCWVFSMGVIFALRFLGGKWRAMRVIVMQVETVET